MPARKDTRFGVSCHIEGFSTACETTCGQPGLTDAVTQACDVGSQAYCTQAANISSSDCSAYLTRAIGTSAAVRLSRDYSNKIKPATSSTVADYYNALGDTVNTYMQTNINNLSTSDVATIMNIINAEEAGGTMGNKVADGVISKSTDGAAISSDWVKKRVLATVHDNAVAWASLTASAILANIQANMAHYQKYHGQYKRVHDLLESKLTVTDLNNSTLSEMRKISPAVKDFLSLFVANFIVDTPVSYTDAGTIQVNLSNQPNLYNSNIHAFLTTIKPDAFTERYANCDAVWANNIGPMTNALVDVSGLSAANKETVKTMVRNYCMSSRSATETDVSVHRTYLISSFGKPTSTISSDVNTAAVIGAYSATTKYYINENLRNTAITIINKQAKAFDATTTKTCNGFSDTKLDLLMRTTNQYDFDITWADADSGTLAPAGTYGTTMSTNALYSATKAAYNATTQFYATAADRANAVAITGMQANTFSIITVGNQKAFSDTKLNTLMLTSTKTAFTTAWNAADVGPFQDTSPTTMFMDINYAALMSAYKADTGFGTWAIVYPYTVVNNQRIQFNLSGVLPTALTPYQKYYAAMLTTTKAEFAAVIATPNASFIPNTSQGVEVPIAPPTTTTAVVPPTPLMQSLLSLVKQADAFNRAIWPYVDTATDPVAIAMTAVGVGPPATPLPVTTATINATLTEHPSIDRKLIYARALKLALKADMTYDKTILAAVNGFYDWLKDAMADVTTDGVVASKCGSERGPTIEECTKLCGIFPEFCESDQAKRCQDPANRYKTKDNFESGGDSPIWWLIVIVSFFAVILAAVVVAKYMKCGKTGSYNSSANMILGTPVESN